MQSSYEAHRMIDQLKAKQDSEKACKICFEVYSRRGGVLPCTIPCGHTLCKFCLEVLIKQRRECAFCRKKLMIREAIPSYDFLNVLEEREQEISAYSNALEKIAQEADNKLRLVEEEMIKNQDRKSDIAKKTHEMELQRLNQKAQEDIRTKELEIQLKLQKEQEMHLEHLNKQKDEEMRQAIQEIRRKDKEEKQREIERRERRRFEMRVRNGIIKLDDSTQIKTYRKRMNHPGVLWAWEGPKGWIPFDKDRNDAIEENFHLGNPSCIVTYKGMKFYIDLQNWLSSRRPNDANPARIKRVNNLPGSAKWYIIKMHGLLEELSPQLNFDIELAWQNNEANVAIQENSEAYKCDLESLRSTKGEISYLLVRMSTLD